MSTFFGFLFRLLSFFCMGLFAYTIQMLLTEPFEWSRIISALVFAFLFVTTSLEADQHYS